MVPEHHKVEWKTPKPLSAGSEIDFEAQFMDQTFKFTYQVTEYVPSESLVMSSTSAPFPMQTSYRFSDTAAGGTRVELRNAAHDPDIANAIEIENRKDLARLKSIVENGGS